MAGIKNDLSGPGGMCGDYSHGYTTFCDENSKVTGLYAPESPRELPPMNCHEESQVIPRVSNGRKQPQIAGGFPRSLRACTPSENPREIYRAESRQIEKSTSFSFRLDNLDYCRYTSMQNEIPVPQTHGVAILRSGSDRTRDSGRAPRSSGDDRWDAAGRVLETLRAMELKVVVQESFMRDLRGTEVGAKGRARLRLDASEKEAVRKRREEAGGWARGSARFFFRKLRGLSQFFRKKIREKYFFFSGYKWPYLLNCCPGELLALGFGFPDLVYTRNGRDILGSHNGTPLRMGGARWWQEERENLKSDIVRFQNIEVLTRPSGNPVCSSMLRIRTNPPSSTAPSQATSPPSTPSAWPSSSSNTEVKTVYDIYALLPLVGALLSKHDNGTSSTRALFPFLGNVLGCDIAFGLEAGQLVGRIPPRRNNTFLSVFGPSTCPVPVALVHLVLAVLNQCPFVRRVGDVTDFATDAGTLADLVGGRERTR
ncbi:hypothetical protein B0H16DRAFT_1461007 [Mycena metata]|uniref:Uncharacterized protein n=1 Tax=Mycena metata TaxID=1033252 RepID=A0AAD7ITB9_9AGAR|nr:hypothetical protein B0H16DRAFT_1461007 [Mycena metata]